MDTMMEAGKTTELSDKIGALAGKIWHYLSSNGEVSYAVLRKEVVGKEFPMPDVALSCALGWLAREKKLQFAESGTGRGYRIRISLNN